VCSSKTEILKYSSDTQLLVDNYACKKLRASFLLHVHCPLHVNHLNLASPWEDPIRISPRSLASEKKCPMSFDKRPHRRFVTLRGGECIHSPAAFAGQSHRSVATGELSAMHIRGYVTICCSKVPLPIGIWTPLNTWFLGPS